MSLYNDASLVMIPSAYKDGKLYSIKPTDGSGDFTFSRGSNLAATRVDENGLIEKGRENLLLQSNQFDTSWNIISGSVTSGQSGYDGNSDAWLLEATSTTGTSLRQSISQSGVQTFSVYAKAGTANYLAFYNIAGSIPRTWFNLNDGSVGTTLNEIQSRIESVGNGWYKCSMTYNQVVSEVRIYVASSDNTFSTSVGDNIYIQDAQLEAGLVATDYIETTTTTAQAGILEDMPRLDYSGGASCPSLLLEPQRSNLLPHSEYFDGTPYAQSYITLTANAAISPEGVQNAYLFVPTTDNDVHRNIAFLSITNGISATISFFAKANGYNYPFLRTNITGSYENYFFDLVNETTNDSDAKIEDYGNGWYRCILTKTTATTSIGIGFGISNDGINIVFSGDGTSGIYFYGTQLEEGSYPTSYIPCYGAATTRSFDNSLDVTDFTSVFGSSSLTQYSIFIDIKNNFDIGGSIVMIEKGDNTQGRINLNGGSALSYYSTTTGYTTNNNISDGNPHKYLLVADNGTIKQYFDGSLKSTDTNTSDELISTLIVGIKLMKLSQYAVFPTALTDSECIALTTL